MYVKRLKIYGFKSFALETDIDFNEGVTVVLGPNGIGKSNIVEAFLWVLGEQSSAKLRIDKNHGLESIIFHGTETKKPSSLAEVTLTLDNSSRWLVEHDLDEVSVKRKYYRKGLSEYYINDKPVLRKNILDLFLDTGFGKSTYSVIKQGMVDKIAQQNPDDRRFLIEDAAGISKYLEKRREANKKLEDSEKNIIQVNTMIRESERSYKGLKEQAERTEKYYKLTDEKKKVQISISLHQIIKLKEGQQNLEKEYQELGELRTQIAAELQELEDKKKIQTEKFEATKDIASNLDKQTSLLFNDITHTERIYEQINSQIVNMSQDVTDAKNKKAELNKKYAEENAHIKEIEKSSKDIMDELATSTKKQEEENIKINSLRVKVDTLTNKITHLNEANNKFNEELVVLRTRQKELIDKIISEIDEKKRDVEQMSFYQNRDKHEQDMEIGFKNLLSSIKAKEDRIDEFETLGVISELNEANFNRLCEFVATLKDKLETEKNETLLLRSIFEEYNKIKDPFIDILFNKEGTYTQKENIDNAISDYERDIQRNNASIEDITNDIKLANEEIEKSTNQMVVLSVNHARLEEKRISLEKQKDSAFKIRQNIEEEMALQAQKIEKLELVLNDMKGELAVNKDKLKELREKRKAMESEAKLKDKEIREALNTINNVSETFEKRSKKLAEINETYTRIAERIEQSKEKIEDIYNHFYEAYAIRLSDFENTDEKLEPEKLKERLVKLNEKLKNIGQINEMALDEYQTAKERFEFLTKQKEDLEKSKVEILNIIEEANKKASEEFRETFHAINEKFLETFKILFGGGKAGLVLQDEHDILNSAIDIFAQPPGKKMENIVAYSGGELTMTGLALVFAIFLYRPSPFCILDEVDAALDGANIVRYKNMVKKLSDKTQFLIITHDDVSATIANTYYGITAEEKGISKIYTVKIGEDGSVNGSRDVKIEESNI